MGGNEDTHGIQNPSSINLLIFTYLWNLMGKRGEGFVTACYAENQGKLTIYTTGINSVDGKSCNHPRAAG